MFLHHVLTAAGSAAAVAALVVIAWGLGFRKQVTIDSEQSVREMILESERQAQPRDILLDKEGRAAIARVDGRRIFVVRSIGDRLAVRDFKEKSIKIAPTADGLLVTFDDIGFPPLKLHLDSPGSGWPFAEVAYEHGS